jgi:hypothetical protein
VSGCEEQGAIARWVRHAGKWRLGTRVLVLGGALLAAYPVVAVVAARNAGPAAWEAAAIAAALCWFGAAQSLWVAVVFKGPQKAVAALLLGMLFRMGVPIVAAVLLTHRFPSLLQSGFLGSLLCFYLLALVAETLLALSLVQKLEAPERAA